MTRKKLGIGALIVVVIIAIGAAIYLSMNQTHDEETADADVFNPDKDPDAQQVSFSDDRKIKRQQIQEQRLTNDYKEGSYPFEDPFIK